ncbi:hypothetical protein SLOPH_851 [Spraguea lophii 42_110]|uniref:Uncharacterized protein n=1 Tax=Spraguea lophii (strain 42_110) TaxID=1358809 RepID=S7XJL8_SPRLO|nr:hypothetical protein SLOPH_851 [Spraguea lophii 42_110]
MLEKIDKVFRKLQLIQIVEEHYDDDEMKNIIEDICCILQYDKNIQLSIENILYDFLSMKNIEVDDATVINIANILISVKKEHDNGSNDIYNRICKING